MYLKCWFLLIIVTGGCIPISSQIHFDTLMADDVSLILINIGRIIQKEVPQIM